MTDEKIVVPKVAVLMATYNGERYLREQIESVLQQKNVAVSLYVRDDNSTDTTVQIINEYVASTGKVFLLENKPGQLNVTKNFLSIVAELDLNNIDYISYCDQDDIWLDNKLDEAVKMINNKQVNCYASNLLRGDANGKIIQRSSVLAKLTNYLFNHKSNKQLRFDHYFEAASAGCTLVLHKDAAAYFHKRVNAIYNQIPVNASHDWSTYAITRIGGYQWYIDNRSYIIYRQHSANAYGVNNGMKGVSKLLDLFKSGWYRKHILMIEDLYNNTDVHPDFIATIRNHNNASIMSRFRVATAVCRYRRKPIHRFMLFVLIMTGYFK